MREEIDKIKNFGEFLNENKSDKINDIKGWMGFIWNKLMFISPIKRRNSKTNNYNKMVVSFLKTDKENRKLLKDKLEEIKTQMERSGVMLSFFINYDEIEFYFKKLNIKIEPSRYVYHSSPISNRGNILKQGLMVKSSEESKVWNFGIEYAYPKAIFVTKINNETGIVNPWMGEDYDIWQIDTDILDNEWFVDLNYTGEKDNNHIMTFKPIPPKYLELVRKGKK